MSKTDDNLMIAAKGEAFARLKYMAYAVQALKEGHAEIAQLFMEAAGAETTHGISHLFALGFVKSTKENLQDAVNGEADEQDEMYPQMIKQAQEEKAPNMEAAVKSFSIANSRESAHEAMFKTALETMN